MINNIEKVKKSFERSKDSLAFVFGNGINLHAYPKTEGTSWEDLLLSLTENFSSRTISEVPNGISFTEFYDVVFLNHKKRSDIANAVVENVTKWKCQAYHEKLQSRLIELDRPVMTTNFDRNLETGLNKYWLEKWNSDQYPWNVYFSDKILDNPLGGFGIWHINGMLDYKRSIKLGLTEYMQQVAYTRQKLHSLSKDDFNRKNISEWNGYKTWLHLIFNCSLCFIGVGLNENEVFLRWLLIERAKYFQKFPERKKKGWYVCTQKEKNEGKRFFFENLGIEMVCLNDYNDIYNDLLEISE